MRRYLFIPLLLCVLSNAAAKTLPASSFLLPASGELQNVKYYTVDSTALWLALAGETRLEITNLILAGAPITLELKAARSPIDNGTQITIGSKSGDMHLALPHSNCYRGAIVGEPHSSVVFCVSGKYVFASIRRESGEAYDLAPERNGDKHLLMRENDLLSLGEIHVPNCFADEVIQPHAPIPLDLLIGARGVSSNAPLSSGTLLQTDIAVEADTCFFHAAGSDVAKVVAYIYSMFAMSSVIYENEANIDLHLSSFKIWTDTDPYNVNGNAYALEDTVVHYWKLHYADVQRDVAHIMTSIGYGGGGYGWFALCDTNWAYSVSSPTTGGRYPTFAFTYDAYIVAHELGHNFSLPHSHNCYWDPPLDTCFTKNDPVHGLSLGDACDSLPITPRASAGTIMSYCANANYALAGNDFSQFKLAMTFSPRVAAAMRTNAEKAACVQEPDSATVILLAPRGQEVITDGVCGIKWTAAHVQNVNLEYSKDGGATWDSIAGKIPASAGSYNWTSLALVSDKMLVRITDASDVSRADTSLLPFTVSATIPEGVHENAGPVGPSVHADLGQSGTRVIVHSASELRAAEITILDVLGNVIAVLKDVKGHQASADISNVAKGTYFVRVKDASGVTVCKIVK